METLTGIPLNIDVDHVLKAQGADPQIIRMRKPRLVEIAQNALEQSLPLLDPLVIYREINVVSLRHERLLLEDKGELKGKLIGENLGPAQKVIIALCTIGSRLEEYSLSTIKADPVLGLAMEGVGSAAVESLANATCLHFGEKAAEENLETTIPLNPGMIGWPVEQGQPQIFKLLDTEKFGIKLSHSHLMLPRKTLSMVIGVGSDIQADGNICDYCMMNETCSYKNHYASPH